MRNPITTVAFLYDRVFPLPLRERVRVRGNVRVDHPHLNPLPSRERRYFKSTVVAALAVLGLVFAASIAQAGPLDSLGAQKALVCSACHGFAGNAPGNTVPILAGINAAYFKKAIKDYTEGKRTSPEMEPYSKYVMQFGVDEIANYFAAQKKQPAKVKADPKAISRGATLATQCAQCHGDKGEGDVDKVIPALRGQAAGFVQAQLALFKADKRKPEDAILEENKKRILKGLDDNDFADLAAYYSTLR
jgi:cytochrome c553